MPMIFRNSYTCPSCNEEWDDEWDCGVDDECPECGLSNITPHTSTDISHGEYAECDGCGKRWSREALDYIEKLSMRTSPDDPMPAGQCPDDECGALCFVLNE